MFTLYFIFFSQLVFGTQYFVNKIPTSLDNFYLHFCAFSKGYVVWKKSNVIYIYDGDKVQTIEGFDYARHFEIQDNKLFFSGRDENKSGIFLYDLIENGEPTRIMLSEYNSGDVVPLLSHSSPFRVHKNHIVCRAEVAYPNNSGWYQAILLHNYSVSDSKPKIISELNEDDWVYEPSIHDGKVAWFEYNSSEHSHRVKYYNGEVTDISASGFGHTSYVHLKVNNGHVICQGYNERNNSCILLFNGSGNLSQISKEHSYNSQIHNGQIVWECLDGGFSENNYEIYLYDLNLDNPEPRQITNNSCRDSYPQIHNGQIVWSGFEGKIYLYDIEKEKTYQISNYETGGGQKPLINNGQIFWYTIEAFLATPISYVALGDSFSAGQGVRPYFEGSDIKRVNTCHRSKKAYSTMIKIPGYSDSIYESSMIEIPGSSYKSYDPKEWSFIACSGAVTSNVWQDGNSPEEAKYNEKSQLDQDSPLDPNLKIVNETTNIITITIGGNDTGFAAIVKKFLFLPITYESKSLFGKYNDKTFFDYYKDNIKGKVKKDLTKLYINIKVQSPNAQVFALGYPLIFGGNVCDDARFISKFPFLQISQKEQEIAKDLTLILNNVISEVVKSTGAHFIPVADHFAGREICGEKKPSWITGIKYKYLLTRDLLKGYKAWCHPNSLGQAEYANVSNQYLKKLHNDGYLCGSSNEALQNDSRDELGMSLITDAHDSNNEIIKGYNKCAECIDKVGIGENIGITTYTTDRLWTTLGTLENQIYDGVDNETSPTMGELYVNVIESQVCKPNDLFVLVKVNNNIRITGNGFGETDNIEIRLSLSKDGSSIHLATVQADSFGALDEILTIPEIEDLPNGGILQALGAGPKGVGHLLWKPIVILSSYSNDEDSDGIPDICDNCVSIANTDQNDADDDGEGDICDKCPYDYENDVDEDGLCYSEDPCPIDSENDADGDGICEYEDNCPINYNPSQEDSDGNGIGDICGGENCYFLNVKLNIPNSGRILSPSGNCNLNKHQDGTMIQLIALPYEGFNFIGWTGDVIDTSEKINFIINKDKNVVANFERNGTDSDGDGIQDSQDGCPNDPDKATPGICGCGVSDLDSDDDGTFNCDDNCLQAANPDQVDTDGDKIGDVCDDCPNDALNDIDGDNVCGDVDNCYEVFNPEQINSDDDSEGDACDSDDDNDGILDEIDNCQFITNPDQYDFDNDGYGDACDNDIDGDGIIGVDDQCPNTLPGEVINDNGCSIADYCPCDNLWKNHGAYVQCVAHTSENFVSARLITDMDKDTIVYNAAKSDCGKKK